MNTCPECGGPLETFLRVDLDGVVLSDPDEYGIREVAKFTVAGSANDPNTGLVVEEANVTCADCGYKIGEANVPYSIMSHWTFTE